ncbi:Tol-Pal system beta propeller repeat protein TolB [Candidatus Curculioniphilus buchneri]|uniref:Tol-Pal system beta propeller repeat protein TolB n=1 Tax=Candidatus Curculioniphilus buchneri TaxID=690594 RepID=UPI00376F3DB6
MKRIIQSILGLLILWSSILCASIRIQITQGMDIARPIGVVPFKWVSFNSIKSEDISEIIAADLRNSGKFNVLDTFNQPQHPTTVSEIISTVWKEVGISAVVIGQVQANTDDNSYIVSYQLIDTSSNQKTILAQNKYKVMQKWLRYAAHTASDEIFEKLTSIQGAFRTRIAYVVQKNSGKYPYELLISDYDGFNQKLIHRSSQPLMSPSWSPDGKTLAYVSFESGRSALLMQALDNGMIRQITNFPRHNGAPSFSPDGTKLAFALSKTGSLNLYIMELNSGHIRHITDCRNNNTEPTWFPDNQTLAYTSDQSGRPQVYKININDGVPQRLSWNGTQNQNANVSSNGKFLVMVSRKDAEQHITKLDLETGSIQVLTDTFMDETPSISPNGTMVIYSTTQGVNSVLQLVSNNGNYKIRLLEINGQIKFPAWSPYL